MGIAKGSHRDLESVRVASPAQSGAVRRVGATARSGWSTGDFVGRRAELQALGGELDETRLGALRVVLIEGPAGIGKTSLVERFLEGQADLWILRAEADELESSVPSSIMDQLLRSASVDRNAQVKHDAVNDHVAIGSCLLEAVAADRARPLAIVVDNAHLADRSSMDTLLWAMRRLRGERVLVLLVTRDHDADAIPESLRRMAAGFSGVSVQLGGLDVDELIEMGAGLLSRHAAVALRDHTGGNPLYVSSLLQEISADAWSDTERALPAPKRVRADIGRALASCTADARALAEATAVLDMSGPLHVISDLARVAEPLRAVAELWNVRVLELERSHGSRSVRFADPLIRAAVYQQIAPARQASLHLAAAKLETEPSRALRHRFEAAHGPDPGLAAKLESVAQGAARQGAWADAASDLLRAARLSRERGLAEQRLLTSVQCMLYSGETARAQTFAPEIAAFAPSPLRDAVLGHLTLREHPRQSAGLLEDAWRRRGEATDPSIAATVALDNAIRELLALRGEPALTWSTRVIELAGPDDPIGAQGRGTQGLALAHLGQVAEALSVLDHWLALPSAAGPNGMPMRVFRGWLRFVSDDLSGARIDLTEAASAALQVGSPAMGVLALSHLARVEFAAGAWDQSAEYAAEAAAVRDRCEGLPTAPFVLWAAILVEAARGDQPALRELARAAANTQPGTAVQVIVTALAKAHAAQGLGDHHAVLDALVPLLDPGTDRSVDVPGLWPWTGLYAEALIALERFEEASAFMEPHEELASRSDRCSVTARLARLRGQVEAGRGNEETAYAAFFTALTLFERAARPYELGQARLALGQLLRRRGKRRDAAMHLNLARQIFAELRAIPALEQTEVELSACGRVRTRGAGVNGEALTPRERAVAALVAAGKTNREVATELVVSVKTVEVHLTRIYAKLGLSSRSQLIVHARSHEQLTADIPPPPL